MPLLAKWIKSITGYLVRRLTTWLPIHLVDGAGVEPAFHGFPVEVSVICNSTFGKEDKNYNGNALAIWADMHQLCIIGVEPIFHFADEVTVICNSSFGGRGWIYTNISRFHASVLTIRPLSQIQTDKIYNSSISLLCQLSYPPMVGGEGLEPPTHGTKSEVTVICNSVCCVPFVSTLRLYHIL